LTIDDDQRAIARRINPAYARGKLVHVITARQQPEAEMIQGMLLEAGIPSTVKRSAGFDVPDMLAAGPRDVQVPYSGADAARRILNEADMLQLAAAEPVVRAKPLLIGLVAAVVVVALVVLLAQAL